MTSAPSATGTGSDAAAWPQSIASIVGNPKPGSRTALAAASVAELLASELDPWYVTADLVDLAAIGPALFRPHGVEWTESAEQHALDAAVELAMSASVLVLATPVYKASYTGLLKTFLDRLPSRALTGVVVVPVTVSGSLAHKLLADVQLRPVLAELGASVPSPPVALEEADLEDLQVTLAGWVSANAELVRAAATALQPVATPAP